MKITFDTEKKTIAIHEAVAVEELVKFFEDNGIDTMEWKITGPEAQMIPYPTFPVFPTPVYPWEITYTGNKPNTDHQLPDLNNNNQ